MSTHADRDTLAAALAKTTHDQHRASDPARSAWVSANAGTGKTYVLTTRVLRLLLAGTRPERILALTYTKAAAAEMSKRVFDRLAAWVTAPPDDLARMLGIVLGRAPLAHETLRARQLFAAAIETPGGLKVQTIHGFCEQLLQRFPLEAHIPPHFEILDETTATALLRQAVDETLLEATGAPGTSLAAALRFAITFAADDGFEEVLRDALRRRSWLEDMRHLDSLRGGDPVRHMYARVFALPADLESADAETALAGVLDAATLLRAAEVLGLSSASDQKLGACFKAAAVATTDRGKIAALKQAFFTQQEELRRNIVTKPVRTQEPALAAALCDAQSRFDVLHDQRCRLAARDAIAAIVTLAVAVMTRYQAAKSRRAALDFDDLIEKTANLLKQGSEDAAASPTQWVLYKLDGGLDHILVDEAQDTSPTQWSVIRALATEFIAGGAGRDVVRTLFAVGDEKQSIYGFQGAAPEMFKAMGDAFGRDAVAAGLELARVPLDVSFRTTAPVLTAVDHVFADRSRVAGVSSSAEAIRHVAVRGGHAGIVEIWDTEKAEAAALADTWEPDGERAGVSPITRLAGRIADTIGVWLENGERLASENRRVRASDILILVRRRRPFAPAMVAALKARGIPVAGADRLVLIDQIAVQDLMALGDFLTLPEDDLALATVLKSPLFGLGDDALMPLAYQRKGQLWTALLAAAKTTPELFGEAADTLKRWRSAADYLPPYEFYARLLDADNGTMRQRMLKRLGSEAADPLDEFLNQALNYDEAQPASLTGFLAALRASHTEIKRDMEQGRDEVRVMTVHGAKGLEAPIVFLPDTCSARSGGRPGGLLEMADVPRPSPIASLMVWPVKTTKSIAQVVDARAALKQREQHERNRLLYVALTRPRDRLYISGYENSRAMSPDCWYLQVKDALAPLCTVGPCADGRPGLRLQSPQTAAPAKPAHSAATVVAAGLPAWATSRPAAEPRLTMPLTPSRLAPLETDDTGEPALAPRVRPAEPSPLPALADDDQRRFLRGTLTHALLEHLPRLPTAARAAGAARFLEARGIDLDVAVRRSIAAEVLAVLDDPAHAALFGPDSQAEVPIVADIPRPHGRGTALRLNGQIDRIVRIGRQILIVDYKTNRPAPREVAGVAEAYLLQLAAYRLGLGRIFPGETVTASILWTERASLMPIPAEVLDAAEQRLWRLGA